MGTWMLAIALCPELVTLITGSADSPPNGTSCSCRPRRGAVWVLPVLGLGSGSREVVLVMDAHVLLKLLQGIVGSLR